MKKLILGLTLMVTGLLCSALTIMSTVISPLNPWSYNDIDGWYGCLLGMKLQIPFSIFIIISVVGLIISVAEAYKKSEK